VLSDELFKKRVEHENWRTKMNNGTAGVPETAAQRVIEHYWSFLPFNAFNKAEVTTPLIKLLDLSQQTKYTSQQLFYSVAIMRLIFGPGRCLLQDPHLLYQIKRKCVELPTEAVKLGLQHTEMGKRLFAACIANTKLIYELVKKDGYNIYHGL
jgi:hypothetical protein